MRTLPCLLLVLVLVSALPDSVRGQTESTSPAQPDTSLRVPDPRTALLLGLIPGGGQIYNALKGRDASIRNRAWLKAVLVVAAEVYYFSLFQQNRHSHNKYDNYYNNYENYDPPLEHSQDYYLERRNHYLELRNKYAWRFVFVYILGLMDGYVDAHLSTFPPDTSYQAQPLPPSNQSVEESP